MLNYYDEIKNDFLDMLAEDDQAYEILHEDNARDTVVENLINYAQEQDITGIQVGSYYCNTYESRKHCYQFSNDVEEALKMYGYTEELEKFKIFDNLVNDGYLNINTMKLDDDALYEEEDDTRWYIVEGLEVAKEINFETIDTIVRSYKLTEVVPDVVESLLK